MLVPDATLRREGRALGRRDCVGGSSALAAARRRPVAAGAPRRRRRVPPQPLVRDLSSRHPAHASSHLRDGETYEVCLTNKLSTDVAAGSARRCIATLRRINPAPFSAFLRFGDDAVLSSSPERFLRVGPRPLGRGEADQGDMSPRRMTPQEDRALSEELRTSEKNRAENLMITDLLRNDLGHRLRDRQRSTCPHLMADRDLRDRAPAGLDDHAAACARTWRAPDCIRRASRAAR